MIAYQIICEYSLWERMKIPHQLDAPDGSRNWDSIFPSEWVMASDPRAYTTAGWVQRINNELQEGQPIYVIEGSNVTSQVPDWFISPIYKLIPGDLDAYDTMLSLAPGFEDVLKCSMPPTIEFIKSLPSPPAIDPVFAVYAVLLEKPDSTPKLYVGSGTNATLGARGRLQGVSGLLPTAVPCIIKYHDDPGCLSRRRFPGENASNEASIICADPRKRV
jgi:hypothetical protein